MTQEWALGVVEHVEHRTTTAATDGNQDASVPEILLQSLVFQSLVFAITEWIDPFSNPKPRPCPSVQLEGHAELP